MAALIALDWGTSHLRGFLLDNTGTVLDQRRSPHGIRNLPCPGVAGFEAAFAGLCRSWLTAEPPLPVVAGGMVGSAQGWAEAPYVQCPAPLSALGDHAVVVSAPGAPGAPHTDVHIAPGVLYDPKGGTPDVIRGEEIQVAGALARAALNDQAACVILPGTHSKWIHVQDRRIVSFATYLTGELFAVLCAHSILGALMPAPGTPETQAPPDPVEAEAAFAQGLRVVREAGPADSLTHHLFAVRTLGLTQRIPAAVLRDYLSGLLIGHELRAALAWRAQQGAEAEQLLIVGEDALCRRYQTALSLFGVPGVQRLENTAPAGLFVFAVAAGLVATPGGARTGTPIGP